MHRLMKRLSRSSFGQSSSNLNGMYDISQSSDPSSLWETMTNDSDSLAMEESLPPNIPPPLPPQPPPRRRRKQTTIFYSSLLTSADTHKESKPSKRPPVPPPIPPRTISMDSNAHKTNCITEKRLSLENANNSSDNEMFANEELIENLKQNLSVMEELNYSLRTELKQSREENSNLMNELAAIHIERKLLLQTCKEIDQLKDNEWQCSICLDDRLLIVETNRQIVATFCGHLFCNSCLNMVLEAESVCPTCRKSIPQKKSAFHYLYF